MRKSLLVLGLLAVALPQLFAEPETAAILSAADTYLRANATVTTELKYIVEQIEEDLARVRINPAEKPDKSTAWIFLRKKEGKWTGIATAAWFRAEEYERLGIPNSLQIPWSQTDESSLSSISILSFPVIRATLPDNALAGSTRKRQR